MEAIRFRGALLQILKKVLTADLRLGTVYLSKVDLADAYMSLWVRIEDFPSVTFLILKKTPRDTQLVGFHLSLSMGYIDSDPYFAWRRRRWPTSQIRPFPRGSRQTSTHWIWQPSPERPPTPELETLSTRLTPYEDIS